MRSFDGFTQLRGEIVDFDGKSFTINTGLGVIQVDALQVECEGEACPEDLLFNAKFGVYGSNAMGSALMPALIQGYADRLDADVVRERASVETESVIRIVHENGKEMAAIDLKAGGSQMAYAGLGSGSAALGMSSRRMKDAEAAQLASNGGADLRNTEYENVVALDGLLILTHPDNPMDTIGLEDLTDIYSGVIGNWSEVGGPDLDIVVHSADASTGTFDTFNSLLLEPLGESLTPAAKGFLSSADLSDAVARTPGAIGFSSAANARAAKVMKIRQECGIVSEPTTFAIKTEEYPLSRRLYLYAAPEGAPAHAQQLLSYALSDEAQGIVEDADFVSLREERASLASQGIRLAHAIIGEDEFSLDAMREMLGELREADRLTTTFRFNQGSTELDARSSRDVTTLARALADGDFDGKEVLLIGFTDSIGQFELNRSLALRRAEQVRQRLAGIVGPQAFGRLAVRTLGYGELTPVGCNNTFEGRQINRRVEVWVRDLS
ncbi:MAG: phosphate ABC transporter substrate-binding/OmpA family protein [Pseudomonadota bacterium]